MPTIYYTEISYGKDNEATRNYGRYGTGRFCVELYREEGS